MLGCMIKAVNNRSPGTRLLDWTCCYTRGDVSSIYRFSMQQIRLPLYAGFVSSVRLPLRRHPLTPMSYLIVSSIVSPQGVMYMNSNSMSMRLQKETAALVFVRKNCRPPWRVSVSTVLLKVHLIYRSMGRELYPRLDIE